MNQVQARIRIWKRLATTAIAELDEDWIHDEGVDEADERRLVKASKQVAKSIRRMVARMEKGRS